MDNVLDLTQLSTGDGGEVVGVTIGEYRWSIFPHKALVFKGDAVVPSYTVDRENGCDCKSATLGGRVCKHMQPLSWFSDGDELSTAPSDDGMVDLSTLLMDE